MDDGAPEKDSLLAPCNHLRMTAEQPERQEQQDPRGIRPEADGGTAPSDGAWAEAMDEDPEAERESAYGLLQRGHELMNARHHAQAATVLARAAGLEPRKGSILEALGRAYYNSGQSERAAETFESLLEVDPSAHYAHYARGQSLKRLGRIREARTHLRLAVALSPSSRLYRSALDRLPATGPEPSQG